MVYVVCSVSLVGYPGIERQAAAIEAEEAALAVYAVLD